MVEIMVAGTAGATAHPRMAARATVEAAAMVVGVPCSKAIFRRRAGYTSDINSEKRDKTFTINIFRFSWGKQQ